MKLCRDNFKSVKENVKNEICCVIPSGTKEATITRIESETFFDWEKLEYVYIPPTIEIVEKNAFIWKNIKMVFVDRTKTQIDTIPSNVKVLPITGNEIALFDILSEVMSVKKSLEFDPETIEKIDAELSGLASSFMTANNERAEEIKNRQKELEETLSKLNDYSTKAKSISDGILKELDDMIKLSLEESVEQKKSELSDFYSKMKTEVTKLEELVTRCSDARSIVEKIEKEISETYTSKKAEIEKELSELVKKLHQSYEKSKQNIINSMVTDATDVLIAKNPCRCVVINIESAKKRFETKGLFHKDFENVLKLVSIKKPILLKGPAGSGKNVILEQVAKALELQFYYLNDVTEEYKVMGFVDANGNYVETQFYKAFTNGGLMFIDEIDNSSPSALLSINAAIGTGFNHYMAFPDGNFYKAHENFYLVAAANTFGTGADAIYCGRQALDGASLNRFLPITIDYDRELERNLVSHKEILDLYWNVRDIVQMNTIRHVISTRNIVNASDLLDTGAFSLGDIFDWTIVQGLDQNDLNIIASRINGNDQYSREFSNHLVKKYHVSKRI